MVGFIQKDLRIGDIVLIELDQALKLQTSCMIKDATLHTLTLLVEFCVAPHFFPGRLETLGEWKRRLLCGGCGAWHAWQL
jgi:hypothetical protein